MGCSGHCYRADGPEPGMPLTRGPVGSGSAHHPRPAHARRRHDLPRARRVRPRPRTRGARPVPRGRARGGAVAPADPGALRQRRQRRATGCATSGRSSCSGTKKSLTARPNGRSADFIAPSTSNGCAMSCSYCYVPRRKGYANPITVFVNIEKILGYLERHCRATGDEAGAEPVRPRRLGLRPRRERRLLGRRDGLRQRPGPGRPVRRPAERQGELRHQVRQPRAARLRPAWRHPGPLLADAGGRVEEGRHPHLEDRRPDRRHGRLRGGRLRGARQLQPGHRPRGVAGGVGRAARPGGRRHQRRDAAGSSPARSSSSPTTRRCTRSTSAGTPRARSCSGARTSSRSSAARAASSTSATAPAPRVGGWRS